MAQRSTTTTVPGVAILVVAGLAVLAVIGLAFGAFGGGPEQAAGDGSPSPTVVAVGGSVWPIGSESPSPAPSASDTPAPATPEPTPTLTPESTPVPQPAGFDAAVFVCRDQADGRCVRELEQVNDGSVTLLLVFENSARGDQMGLQLRGPGGTIDAGTFTVRGGDGYAWSGVGVGGLEPGEWEAVGLRNGEVVATRALRVR